MRATATERVRQLPSLRTTYNRLCMAEVAEQKVVICISYVHIIFFLNNSFTLVFKVGYSVLFVYFNLIDVMFIVVLVLPNIY